MIELPDTSYVSRIADWIELQILFSGKSLSKNKIISIIDDHSGDADEVKIDSAIQELIRRLNLYGKVKPYDINGNIVTPAFDWKKFPELTLCLIFSTHGAADADKGTKLFERLTKECVDQYFNFQSVHFGFPANIPFKQQLDYLATACSEDRNDDPSQFDKDRGVDVVSWKNFEDSRNSQIYLLIQCAAGGKWRDKKAIPMTSWRRFIGWNFQTTIPAIAVSQIIEAEKWKNAVDDYGIVIDRARLYRMITAKGYKTEPSLKKEIHDWCKTKFN